MKILTAGRSVRAMPAEWAGRHHPEGLEVKQWPR